MSATPGVDVATVARVFGVNVSSVHRLVKEPGFPPKLAPGVFDLQKATIWYIRYLQSVVRRRGPSGGPETAAVAGERLRLLRGQAEKIELGNAVERGEFLPTDSIRSEWSRRASNTQRRLLALPNKLAVILAHKKPAYVAERLREELYLALNELAASGGTDPVAENSAVEADAPAAEVDNS